MIETKEFLYKCEHDGIVYWTKKLQYRDFGSFIMCEYFYSRNDEWIRTGGKGVRLMKKVKKNNKGRFITFEKKRYYL